MDAYCIPCAAKVKREWRQTNREKVKEQKRNAYWRNPERERERNKERWAAHPEYGERERDRRKRDPDLTAFYRHGITTEQIRMLDEFEEGVCPLCRIRPTQADESRQRRIDHSHATGFVRGLLCHQCNALLGWYETNKEIVDSYIVNPPARQLGLIITTDNRRRATEWPDTE
jgi:hypothetical protein